MPVSSGSFQRWTEFRKPKTNQPEPLDFSKPIDATTVSQTRTDLQRQAQQINSYLDPDSEVGKRVSQLAEHGAVDPGGVNRLLQVLDIPAQLVRMAGAQLVNGDRYSFEAKDYWDVLTAHDERVTTRHREVMGRSGQLGGTDILETMGVNYHDERKPGPWDDLARIGRGVGATAIDIFSDPTTYFSFGLVGMGKKAATEASEIIVKQAAKHAVDDLAGQGARILVDSADEFASSPLSREIIQRTQDRLRQEIDPDELARLSIDEQTQLMNKKVNDIIGFKSADEMNLRFDEEMRIQAGVEPDEWKQMQLDQLGMGQDAGVWRNLIEGSDSPTIYGSINTEVAHTIVRKRFHSKGATWRAYTDEVMSLPNTQQNGKAMATIGGLKFSVPGFDSTTRRLGGVTRGTQGMLTKFSRAESRASLNTLREGKTISSMRQGWRHMRKKATERNRFVNTLMEQDAYSSNLAVRYIGMREAVNSARLAKAGLGDLNTYVAVDALVRTQDRLVKEITDDAVEKAEIHRVLNYAVSTGQDIDQSAVPNATAEQVEALNGLKEKLVAHSTATAMRYERFDAEFYKLRRANPDRPYLPLRLSPELQNYGHELGDEFNSIADEWLRFRRAALQEAEAAEETITESEMLTEYARQIGQRVGIELDVDEMAGFLQLMGSFARATGRGPVDAVGAADVMKMRRLGVGAIMFEKDGQLLSSAEFFDPTELDRKYVALVNKLMGGSPSFKGVDTVFDLDPSRVSKHWQQSTAEAALERLQQSYLLQAGYLSDRMIKVMNSYVYMRRLASSGELVDAADIVQRLYRFLNSDDYVPEETVRHLLKGGVVKSVTIEMGNASIKVPRSAYVDPQFQDQMGRLLRYVQQMYEPAAYREMVNTLLAKYDYSELDADKIAEVLRTELQAGFDAELTKVKSNLTRVVNRNKKAANEALIANGAKINDLAQIDRQIDDELQAALREWDDLSSSLADQQQRVIEDYAARTKNLEMQRRQANQTVRDHVVPDTVASRSFTDPEEVTRIIDDAKKAAQARITDLYRQMDDEAIDEKTRQRLVGEVLEERRIAEGLDEIPVSFVEPAGEELPIGWIVPERNSADLWVEYWPGFGGVSWGTGPSKSNRVWPSVNGVLDESLATALGWNPRYGTVEQFYQQSFLEVAPGLYRMDRGSDMPLYVFGNYGLSRTKTNMQRELTKIWHRLNADVAEGGELTNVRIAGMTSDGYEPISAGNTSMMNVVERYKGKLAERTSPLVKVEEFYDNWIKEEAESIYRTQEFRYAGGTDSMPEHIMTISEALRRDYPLSAFIETFTEDGVIVRRSGPFPNILQMSEYDRANPSHFTGWDQPITVRTESFSPDTHARNERIFSDLTAELEGEQLRLQGLLDNSDFVDERVTPAEVAGQLRRIEQRLDSLHLADPTNPRQLFQALSAAGAPASNPYLPTTTVAFPLTSIGDRPPTNLNFFPEFVDQMVEIAQREGIPLTADPHQMYAALRNAGIDLDAEFPGVKAYEYAYELSPEAQVIVEQAYARMFPDVIPVSKLPKTSTGYGRKGGVNVGRTSSSGVVGERSKKDFGNPWSEGDPKSKRPTGLRVGDMSDEEIRATLGVDEDKFQQRISELGSGLPDRETTTPAPVFTDADDLADATDRLTREEAVALYDVYIRRLAKRDPNFADDVRDLKGKRLLCPGPEGHKPCHADSLAKLAEELWRQNPATTRQLRTPGEISKAKIIDDGTPSPLRKIISGGQVGADRLGLEIGSKLGLETGGTAPAGWRVSKREGDAWVDAADPTLADFGLSRSSARNYQARTLQNVKDSDATVIFAGNENSPGTKLTKKYAKQEGKPYIVNPSPEDLHKFVLAHGVEVLNVAGNREFTNSQTMQRALEGAVSPGVLEDAYRPLTSYEKLQRLQAAGWEGTGLDLKAWSDRVPEQRLGSLSVLEAPDQAAVDLANGTNLVDLGSQQDEMWTEFSEVINRYRDEGSPTLSEDSPFWDWFEQSYPGSKAIIDGRLSGPDPINVADFGHEVKSIEYRLMTGAEGTETQIANMQSAFGDTATDVANNFIREAEAGNIPADYAELWNRFQVNAFRNPNAPVEEELLPAVWTRPGGRLETFSETEVYAVADRFTEHVEGFNGRNPIGRDGRGRMPNEDDIDVLEADVRESLFGSEDEVSEISEWLEDVDTELTRERPHRGVMEDPMYGSFVAPEERTFLDTIAGRAYVDVNAMEGVAQRRLYRTSYKSMSDQRKITNVLGIPEMEEGDPIVTVQGVLGEQRVPPGKEAYGLDEMYVDEEGGMQRIGLHPNDPKRAAELEVEAIRKESEAMGKYLQDDGVARQQLTGGIPQSRYPGDMTFFVDRQAALRKELSTQQFNAFHLVDAALESNVQDFINQGNVLFGLVERYEGERVAAYAGIDLSEAARAWRRFKDLRDYAELNNVHLQRALGLGFTFRKEAIPVTDEATGLLGDSYLTKLRRKLDEADDKWATWVMGNEVMESTGNDLATRQKLLATILSTEEEIDFGQTFWMNLDPKMSSAFERSPNTRYVGRDFKNERGKFGNAFIGNPKDSRYLNFRHRGFDTGEHPWLKRKVEVIDEAGNVSFEWEPVRYELVSSEVEATERFFNTLWDMLEDPDMGPAWREELISELSDKLIGVYAGSTRGMSNAKVLAEAVDLIADGVIVRPTSDIIDISTTQRAMLDELASKVNKGAGLIDIDSQTQMYDMLAVTGEMAQDQAYRNFFNRILRQLTENDRWVQSLFDPGAGVRTTNERMERVAHDVMRAIEQSSASMGGFINEDVGDLLRMMLGRAGEDFDTAMLSALARMSDPNVMVVRHVTDDGLVSYRVERPGSFIADAKIHLDTKSANAARGITSDREPALSEMVEELIDMPPDEVFLKGLDVPRGLADDLREARERLDIARSVVADNDARKAARLEESVEDAKAAVDAERELEQLEFDYQVMTKIVNYIWNTIRTGDRRYLRNFMGISKNAPFGEGKNHRAFERMLAKMSPQRSANIRFMYESALVSPSVVKNHGIDGWLELFHRQSHVQGKVEKSIVEMIRAELEKGKLDPVRWHQLFEADDKLSFFANRVLWDIGEFASRFPTLDENGYLKAAIDQKRAWSSSSKPGFSADMRRDAKDLDDSALVERILDAMRQLDTNPTLSRLFEARVGNLGIVDDMSPLHQIVETMRVRPEEKELLTPGMAEASKYGLGEIYNGYLLQPAVGMELNRAVMRMLAASDVQNSMELMATANGIRNWWQKAATVGRPTFHMRNLIGGMWNNLLIGVSPIRSAKLMPDVWRFIRNRRRLAHQVAYTVEEQRVIDEMLLDGIENKDLFRAAIQTGIMDTAFSSTISATNTQASLAKKMNPFSSSSFIGYDHGGQAMEFIEGILRIAAFEKYYDPVNPYTSSMMADIMVNLVHFDYTDLSKFDQWIKRFVPFWVWTSRNLPLQMRMLLENPKNIIMYNHARENWNEQFEWETDEDGNLVQIAEAQHLTSGLRWVLPFKRENEAGDWVQLTWEPALPFADLLDTPLFSGTFGMDIAGVGTPLTEGAFSPANWAAWVTGSLVPPLSTLTDLAGSAGDAYRTENAPPGFNALFSTFMPTTPQGDVQVSPWVGSALGTGLPFMTEYTELMGMRSNSPYSAGNQGLLPEEFMGPGSFDTMWRVAGQRLGRGFGLNWQSPEDAFWTYKELQRYVAAARLQLRGSLSEAYQPIGPQP